MHEVYDMEKWILFSILLIMFSQLVAYLHLRAWEKDTKYPSPTHFEKNILRLLSVIAWPNSILVMVLALSSKTARHGLETIVVVFSVILWFLLSIQILGYNIFIDSEGAKSFSFIVLVFIVLSIVIGQFYIGVRDGTLFED